MDHTLKRIKVSERAEQQFRSLVVRRDELRRRVKTMETGQRRLREEASRLRSEADAMERAAGRVRRQNPAIDEKDADGNWQRVQGTGENPYDRYLSEIQEKRAAATERTDMAAKVAQELQPLREASNQAGRLVDAILQHLGARSERAILVDWVDLESELVDSAIRSAVPLSGGRV